jgi:hypothetical protein
MNPGARVLAAAAIVLAVGCAGFAKRAAADYERGDASPTRFAQDNAACGKQSEADQQRYGVGSDLDPMHSTYNRMYDACMRASGYKRKPE